MTATKKVFFTDEKNFYLNPPVNNQCLDCHCLLLQRASLLHAPWFLLASPSKVKDDFTSHQKRPKWTQNFYFATETGFRLQDSSASWLHFPTGWCTCIHCTCSTHSSGSPPTAPDSLSRMSGRQTLRTWICWISAGLSCLGNTLQCYHKFQFQSKPKSIDELKDAQQSVWDVLPQNSINKAVLSITKRLWARVKAGGGHVEHIV